MFLEPCIFWGRVLTFPLNVKDLFLISKIMLQLVSQYYLTSYIAF